jgi:bifunctional non-homologous end joining protein LigD
VLDTKGAVVHWVKPQLVANFEFATWTKTGRIRKPATFLGFRKDKKPKQVVREVPEETISTSSNSNWPDVEKQPQDDITEFELDDCTISLYDVGREIWKGISKASLIEYYHNISKFILPHISNRPQSLHIKLNGAYAPGLYIKDMEGRQPECAAIFTDRRRHKAEGKRNVIDYLVCNNEATLLWMINIGCIDVNPWSSRITDPEHPDYLIIDLDPSEQERTDKGLDRLRRTAMAAKEYCDKKGIRAFVKTSGKTGIHFLIPCRNLTYSEARAMTEHICEEIHLMVPDISTVSTSIAQRADKVYIDPSQNDYADTIAAPYSVRPFHRPTVSAPLEWKEINMKLDPYDFTMETILKRLARKGDLFSNLMDKKIIAANMKALKKSG